MNLKLDGNVVIVSKDTNGDEVWRHRVHNLVPTTGLDLIIAHLSTIAALVPEHFCLGTGTTAADSTDTGLQSTDYDIAFTGSTIRSMGITFEGTIFSTDGSSDTTWNEIGLFTSSSSLVARALISPLTKVAGTPTNEYIYWAFDIEATT